MWALLDLVSVGGTLHFASAPDRMGKDVEEADLGREEKIIIQFLTC